MKRIVYILVMGLLLVMVAAVGAQEDSLTFEIEGELTFTEEGDIMVGDVIIAPASAFVPAEYEEGEHVVIVGTLLNNDTLQAISLEVVEEEEEVVDESTDPLEDLMDETDEDAEVSDEEVVDEDELVTVGDHPVATALATEFELDYDEVAGWHDDGMGYGEIAQVLILADQLEDMTYEEVMEQVQAGVSPTRLAKENGLSPSVLAPGRVISGRYTSPDAVVDGESTEGYVSVNATVNLRLGAGTDTEVAGTLQPGDTFVIVGEEGGWYLIELEDGTQVYVFAELISEGEVPDDFEETVVDDGGSTGDSGGTSSNQGNVQEGETNKFGCEGRGNSCNTPAEENRNNGGGNGNRGNGGGNGRGNK